VWPCPLQALQWEFDVSIASILLQITTGPDVSGLKNGTFSLTMCRHPVNACELTGSSENRLKEESVLFHNTGFIELTL
jgi:hypothetical protein